MLTEYTQQKLETEKAVILKKIDTLKTSQTALDAESQVLLETLNTKLEEKDKALGIIPEEKYNPNIIIL